VSRLPVLSAPAPLHGRSPQWRPSFVCASLLALALPLIGSAALAQGAAPAAAPQGASGADPRPASGFDISAVQGLLARGDAAVSAGNLPEARRLYDQAREVSKSLTGFYRSISGAFRGLDARIPREMDDKGRQALDLLTQANLRLAALFRREGQPEVAVPLLVEVVAALTPASDQGRKAYQQLLEIGFVSTPYAAGVN
jgi:hypothetical protein